MFHPAVRGSRGFSDGQHFWEVKFLEPLRGSSVMVGVGTLKAAVRSKMWSFLDMLGEALSVCVCVCVFVCE